MRITNILLLFILIPGISWSQKDIKVVEFKNQHVIYTDLGISPAPFNIQYPFSKDIHTLYFKNNFKPIMGITYAYKWFGMRISFPIMPGFRNIALYGKTQHFSLGFDYSFNRLYTDFDFRINTGYALENANKFDSSLSKTNPNIIIPSLNSNNLSANLWYFNHDNYKMNALEGKRAHFNGEVHTWYIKGTLNFFGVNNKQKGVIPYQLQELTKDVTRATALSSIDYGIIPGYAYANRIRNWQFSGWAGVGPVVQSKFYVLQGTTNGYIGLAPRYDIRFVGGYSTEKQFVLLAAYFDNKSIRFNDLRYDQYFYTIRLVTGYRIPPKTKHPKGRRRQREE